MLAFARWEGSGAVLEGVEELRSGGAEGVELGVEVVATLCSVHLELCGC